MLRESMKCVGMPSCSTPPPRWMRACTLLHSWYFKYHDMYISTKGRGTTVVQKAFLIKKII